MKCQRKTGEFSSTNETGALARVFSVLVDITLDTLLILNSFRQDLYKKGGLISVTSRILVVDMLQSDIPTDLITGLLVMHAERPVVS